MEAQSGRLTLMSMLENERKYKGCFAARKVIQWISHQKRTRNKNSDVLCGG